MYVHTKMAATLETLQYKGSDVFYGVCCLICEDDGIYKEGRFHCKKCSKYFCDSCVLTHNKFHKEHSVTEKGGSDNWPVTKTVDDSLEFCEEHTTEKLTMFCEDDEKLLCHVCHLRNHKQCSQVVLLTDKVKTTTRPMDVAQMKTSIESLMERLDLEDVVKIGEQNIISLQTSYEKVLEEIVDARRLINDSLDRLQHKTEIQLKELHSTLKTTLENSRKQSLEFIVNVKRYNIKDTQQKSPERSFIMYRKCLDQMPSAELFLRKAATNAPIEFHLNKDLTQFLASCTEFGSIASREAVPHHVVDPNKIVSIMDKSQYNVRTATDKMDCHITGIWESSNRELIIADFHNKSVKILNRAYNSIEKIQIPNLTCYICNISSNKTAIIVCIGNPDDEIDLLQVDKGMIVNFNTLPKFSPGVCGIAIHQDDIFVTSGEDVSQYTMDGRLVKKLYEDKSTAYQGNIGYSGVGVSLDGKKIYVTGGHNGTLLTLTRDGLVTSILQDPVLRTDYTIPNLHVTARGHVLVLGRQYVSQVDTNGKKLLNTISLDISDPTSVYFNESTSMMIVAFSDKNNIIEFKTKLS